MAEEFEKNVVVLLAKQRSGTNMFRKSLSETSAFYNMKEIFHEPKRDADVDNFWDYQMSRIAKNPRLIVPTKENRDHLLDSFLAERLDTIHAKKPKAKVLVDVKYNSTLHSALLWESPVEIPYFLRYIKARNLKVFHLIRTNVFAAYMSSFIAKQTNVWHNFDGTKSVDDIQVEVPISDLVQQIKFREREINYFRNKLKSLEVETLELVYEELNDPETNNLSMITMERIREFLDDESIPPTIPISTSKVVTRNFQESITNYGAVKKVLGKLERAHWLA